MVNVRPAVILESGRIVKQGELLRIETTNRGVIVGRFVNAVMDMLNKERFNIRIIREDDGSMETIVQRFIKSVNAY